MVRDRLAEMQAKSAEASEAKSKKKESNGTPLLSSEQQLEDCLQRVSSWDSKIRSMRDEIDQMRKLQRNIVSNPLIDKSEVQKLDQTSDKVYNAGYQFKKEITDFRVEVNGMHLEPSHNRIVRNHIDRLESDLRNTLNDFKASQVEYINKTQKIHKRECEIVSGQETSAGGAGGVDPNQVDVFGNDYFIQSQKERLALREVEARHEEIKKIENSVVEVNRLFKEINALVMEQGETITTIEQHVNQTTGHVENAVIETKKAKDYQSKARRKKICIIGILVAILLIVAIIVTIVIVNNKNN